VPRARVANESTYMDGEASFPPVASSPVLRDTSHDPGPSSPAGSSYELHDFRQKARNIATAASDDERDLSAQLTENLSPSRKRRMSRAPLLVRSSPAQGTGKLMNHLAFRARAVLRRRMTGSNARSHDVVRPWCALEQTLRTASRILRRFTDTLVEPRSI